MASLRDLAQRVFDSTDLDEKIGRLANRIPQTYTNAVKHAGNMALNTYNPVFRGIGQAVQTPQFKTAFKASANELFNTAQQGAPAAFRLLKNQYSPNLMDRRPYQGQGQDALKALKLGATALGATSIKPLMMGTSGALYGGFNKYQGGSFSEGFGKGIAISPSFAGISKFTNPVVNSLAGKVANKVASPLAHNITSRGATGALNIPEGIAMDQTMGYPTTPVSMGIDFLSGAVTGRTGMGQQSKMALKSSDRMLPEDQKLIADILERLNFKDTDLDYFMKQRPQDIKALRGLFEMYGSERMAGKMKDQELINWGLERLMYDRNVDNLTGAMGLAQKGNVPKAGLSDTPYSNLPDYELSIGKFDTPDIATEKMAEKLKRQYPDGITLYHQQSKQTASEISKNGFRSGERTYFTALRPVEDRIMDNGKVADGLVEIKILPEDYRAIFPDENSFGGTTKTETIANLLREGLDEADITIPRSIANKYIKSRVAQPSIPDTKATEPFVPDGMMGFVGTPEVTSPSQTIKSKVLPQEPQQSSRLVNDLSVRPLSKEPVKVNQLQAQSVLEKPVQPQLPKAKEGPSDSIISNSYNYNKLDQAYTESLDRFHPISKLGKAANKNQVIQNALTGHYGSGSIAKYHLDFELSPILKSGDVDGLRKAAIMQRDLELAGRGIKGSGQDIKMNITPEIKAQLGKLYAYQDKLVKDYLIKTGIMTEESFKAMKANNKSYVPFKRVMDQVDEFLGIPQAKSVGSVGSQSVIKKIKGSDREIVDPLESIVENTYKIVGLGQRQKVAQAIVSLKDDLPKGMVREFKGVSIGNDSVISLFVNGKVKKYVVPREVEEAAKGLNEDQLGTLVKILSAPTKIFRASATSFNPEFMIPNVARDLQSAFVNVGLNPLRFVSGVAHFIKRDKVYQEFLKSGGMTSFTSLDRKFFKQTVQELSGKGITVKKPSDLLRIIQNVAAISEQPTRISAFEKVYNQALKSGKSIEEARSQGAYAAQESTVNFGRRGSKTQSLNAVFAFLNARMQGLDRTVRSLKKDPVGAGTRLGLVVMAPGMATYAWNQQYPDYYNERIVTKNDKQNNFIIMLPEGGPGGARFVKIPKGDVGKMFNPVEAFLDYARGKDNNIRSAVDGMLKGFSPMTNVGDLIPTALRPIVEDKANKNFFFDSPIVPEYQKKEQPRDQFRSFTPSVYRAIGDKTNISPARMQNAVEGYGTGWAKIGSNIAENFINNPKYKREDKGSAPINSTPIARRFLGGAKYSEEEYKQIESYKKKEKLEKQMQKTGTSELADNELHYKNTNGEVSTIDLTPPTKGQGIDAFVNENWNYTKAREIWKNKDNMNQEDVDQAFKTLGVDKEDVRYDYIATKSNDIKTQYILSKNLEHDELINRLITGRQVSETGGIFASEGVLKNLNEQGLISDSEYKALKKLKFDKDGKEIASSKSGGKKPTKITFKKVSPGSVKMAKIKKSKAPKIKFAKAPVKSKPKSSKTVKIVTPARKISYKVVGPSKIRGLTKSIKLA